MGTRNLVRKAICVARATLPAGLDWECGVENLADRKIGCFSRRL